MAEFKSPYGFYIFSIIGRNNIFYKNGFATDIQKRINEWRRDLKKISYAKDYKLNVIHTFDGVYKIDDKYLLLVKKNTFYQNRDVDIRELLFNEGITKEKEVNIYLDKTFDELFTKEGIRFVNPNITYNEIKNKINDLIQKIKEGKIDKRYYYILDEKNFLAFKKEIENNNQFISKNNNDFYDYFCKLYGNDIIVNPYFIKLLSSELINRDFTNKITYDDIFTKMIRDPFMSENTTKLCIETDRRIHNLYTYKRNNVINTLESWINNELYETTGEQLF